MQQATTVSLQLGFSGPPEGNLISLNLIDIKEERVEGLGGFEPPTCGLGNRGARYRHIFRITCSPQGYSPLHQKSIPVRLN